MQHMTSTSRPDRHLIGDRVASAKNRAEKVQENIELAQVELHMANLVITDKLAEKLTDAELSSAVVQNTHVEAKLQDASDDLQVVTELLKSEERDRKQLEQTIAHLSADDGTALAGARSGEGSASVIEHLRELTRHKVAADHAEPGRHDLLSSSLK